jgi:hypothetical protein
MLLGARIRPALAKARQPPALITTTTCRAAYADPADVIPSAYDDDEENEPGCM